MRDRPRWRGRPARRRPSLRQPGLRRRRRRPPLTGRCGKRPSSGRASDPLEQLSDGEARPRCRPSRLHPLNRGLSAPAGRPVALSGGGDGSRGFPASVKPNYGRCPTPSSPGNCRYRRRLKERIERQAELAMEDLGLTGRPRSAETWRSRRPSSTRPRSRCSDGSSSTWKRRWRSCAGSSRGWKGRRAPAARDHEGKKAVERRRPSRLLALPRRDRPGSLSCARRVLRRLSWIFFPPIHARNGVPRGCRCLVFLVRRCRDHARLV